MDIWTLAFAIIALIVGVVVGYLYRKSNHEKEIAGAKNTASQILEFCFTRHIHLSPTCTC